MDETSSTRGMTEQDRQISEIVAEERSRLRNFIRRRAPDSADVEDIVQEVFYELVDELELAVDELPDEQCEVFVAHELEGRSFKELSAESGVNRNTLLSRKRYAVLHLRERLQSIYDEFTKK
jgi:DNA-directed RNA polymerase specialized sigma24 family protein